MAGRGHPHVSVAIVGCGFSGMCAAIQLKRAGIHDIVIFEASDDIGGTWMQNVYPGCACHVPSALYCFSFEQCLPAKNFNSSTSIHEYQHVCMEKYGLWSHVKLQTRVTTAAFDESSGWWTVQTADGKQTTAQLLILAQGLLNTPRIPPIPGLDSFPGAILHTAAWDKSCKLTGKRVAVVGTGASAIQVIPELQPLAQQLIVFQRSAAWVLKRSHFVSPGLVQIAASKFKCFAVLLRWYMFCFYDLVNGGTIVADDGTEVVADAIVFATGFEVSRPLRSFEISGLGGKSLGETPAATQEGYLGLAVSGFPNMFTMLGPNTYLGHNSTIFMMECAANYIVQVATWMAKQGVKWVNVKQHAQDRYNALLKPRLQHTPWLLGGCRSWYLDEGGKSSEVMWPGLCIEYQRKTSTFNQADWEARN